MHKIVDSAVILIFRAREMRFTIHMVPMALIMAVQTVNVSIHNFKGRSAQSFVALAVSVLMLIVVGLDLFLREPVCLFKSSKMSFYFRHNHEASIAADRCVG